MITRGDFDKSEILQPFRVPIAVPVDVLMSLDDENVYGNGVDDIFELVLIIELVDRFTA